MILVVTGMFRLGFDRLIIGIDELVNNGIINTEVFIQTGYSKYYPKHCAFTRFLSPQELEQHIKKCDLLITHGGAGLIADGLSNNKRIIACPRRKHLNEHINDHQLELTSQLEKEGRILVCHDIINLPNLIKDVDKLKSQILTRQSCTIHQIINDYLENIQNKTHK